MKKSLFAKILMVIGALLVVCSIALLCYNNYLDKKASIKSQEVMQPLINLIDDDKDSWKGKELTEKEVDGNMYVGFVSIPKLNLDLPVLSRWETTTSRIAPSRYSGNAETDDLVLAAHSYRYHFGFIGKLRPNDKIIFKDMDGRVYLYEVKSVEYVYPTQKQEVMEAGYDLTLYTCTYSATKRIVVFCDKIK